MGVHQSIKLKQGICEILFYGCRKFKAIEERLILMLKIYGRVMEVEG